MKKIATILLVFAIFWMNSFTLCASAIQSKAPTKDSKISYINMNWWEEFGDEYLESYIIKAIQNNYDLKIASLSVEEARQAYKIQFANELPSLSVGASPIEIKMPGETNMGGMFSMPIIASYELDLFLKNRDKSKSVKKLYEVQQLNEKAAYIAIIGTVGAVYYNIVKLDKLITIQEEIIKDRAKILELMKQSNEIGIISTSDLVKADKAYILATSDIVELKKAREVMLNTLAVLIGESPSNTDDFKRISYDKLSYQKNIPASISSKIIENRPDYLAAEKMIEKAKIDVRVAKKEFLPTIDILGLLGFNYSSMLNSFNWTNALAGVGASVLMPLFTGGKRIANLKINKNRYEQILYKYYKTNLVAIQEINDALSGLKLDNEKYVKNVKSLELEEKDLNYTKAKYETGIISYLDYIQKRETMLVTKKLVVSSKIDEYIDQISLYKATAAADTL